MTDKENIKEERTLKSLINTPLKKAMFIVQIISYILIPGSPLIGGAIGGWLGLSAGKIGGLILAIFIAGEILFYGSLAFLGKEVVLLIRDKLKKDLRKKTLFQTDFSASSIGSFSK